MIDADKIKAEIGRLKEINKRTLDGQLKVGCLYALNQVLSFLSTLETETTYDTQQYTPRPSVGIEDVARVQFASHAKVFDKKRKAVFDWSQFKEVAGIFYGFGKKDSSNTLESEKPEKGIDVTDFCKPIESSIAKCIADHWFEMLGEEKSEKPMNQDELEEEFDRFVASGKSVTVEDCGTYKVSYHDFKKVARHFAEWGYLRAVEKYNEIEYNKQRAEEEIPNDLEEAAKKEYPCDKSWMTPDMLDLNAHKQVAFRKGAKWKESQPDQLPSDLNGAAIDFADNARKELFAKDYAISSIADYDHGCIDGFIAGAEWMAKQGMTVDGHIIDEMAYNGLAVMLDNDGPFKPNEQVVVQIRKK